jgi:phospholipid/cholesterol/gamma-HCH transport system ATP-binding protein
MESIPAISFRNMDFDFEQHAYFRGLSVDIRPGEAFAFFSVGNSGKSFLLRMIMGLVRPSRGTVCVNGVDLADYFPERIYDLRQQMKFISRDSDLINNLTVFNNIALSLDFTAALPDNVIAARVNGLLRDLSLTPYVREFPVSLHEDIKKRIALARAIISQPEVLLVDEFAYGYDEVHAKRAIRLMHDTLRFRFPRPSLTTVIATAQVRHYLPYVDRVGVIFKKELIFVGTSQELVRSDHPVVRGLLNGDMALIDTEED